MVDLKGLKELIESISKERNLPRLAVQSAIREALLKGYERFRRAQNLERKQFDEDYFNNFDVQLDVEDEGFRVVATKTIVEEVTNSDHEISLKQVQEMGGDEAQLGQEVVLDVTPDQGEFGRMAAMQTKQVLAQKLRDQQRQMVQEEFQDLEGTVLQARVLRFERQSVIMAVSSNFGQPEVEAELPKREQLPNDNYRANATFKVYLKRVSQGQQRGPQLLVSRADAGLVVYLFANEVPEIEDEVVRIVAVAREANPPSRYVGPRTKIAVDTLDRDVDPVGACIGARGSRIQVVVNELRGEKIDVIRWSPDPATYIANALSPARVDEVRLMDPETRQTHVLVAEDQLSLAIGKEGQNVRLAARLTGWKIDIKDKAKYDYAAEDAKFAETRAQHASEEFDEVEEILEEEVTPTETQIHEEIPLEKFSPEQLSEQIVNLEQEKTELLQENEIFETTKEESV
ncbi:MAG: transcription termination factor NusA [Mastigocoleus sp. MO_167.B18]|uniref:transcription termination factor NusA n=1 Tax=Mastigocoleus sp. MO_188.B34 TaxID=3036635 RepID=UPI00262D9504|nr:transcription termination factor NusA [Mastigocoleus sp. MO_188.B34]MDJ0694695.1 transcription termination factor NusA [Mastigocoleus sp. MO_188.B34]MDJ0773675.1 transcription termination factor NusA [Mastigocoleus sp. MO_167.B18]